MSRKDQKAVWAVLLGCRCRKDGSLSGSQKRRCDLAIAAYEQGLYQKLLICGGHTGGEKCESEYMAQYIQKTSKRPIPIVLEKNSQNTWQNFEEAFKILGNQPILILTSQSHAFRSRLIARHHFDQLSSLGAKETHLRHYLREAGSLSLYFLLEMKKGLKRKVR